MLFWSGVEKKAVVNAICIFFTSKFRRVRTFASISIVEHTKLGMRVIAMAPSRVIAKTRSIPILYSGGMIGYSFFSTRLMLLPNNVPNTSALRGYKRLHGLMLHFTRRRGPVTTVYTTPVMLNGLKLLGNGGTAYCPNFRRCLRNTRYANTPMRESNGVVANGKPNTTVRFTLTMIRLLRNGRGIRRLGRTVYMASL